MAICLFSRAFGAISLSMLLLGLSAASRATEANANALAVQARSELGVGNITRAELLYAQAMQEAPNDVGLSMTLAEIYIAQRRFEEAERLITTAMQSQPSDFRAWKTRGLLQRAQGNEANAIRDYEKAFSLGGKEDVFVVQNLQQHYEKVGNDVRRRQMDNVLRSPKAKEAH